MTAAARERLQVQAPVLCISAVAWILLLAGPGCTAMQVYHSGMTGISSSSTLGMLLMPNSPAPLALGWALMLAAMMGPLLSEPVLHVRDRSFARRRAHAIALFVAGYSAVWMAVGVVLLGLALVAELVAPESYVPVTLAIVIALVWQFSPVKQRCLNRFHAQRELAAFGWAADIDAIRFGLTQGVWCAGACWALMLIPLLISRGHLEAMAAVTVWLFAEQLEKPGPLCWRRRGPGTAVRIVVAQARMRLSVLKTT